MRLLYAEFVWILIGPYSRVVHRILTTAKYAK